jgi:hypothetical protein
MKYGPEAYETGKEKYVARADGTFAISGLTLEGLRKINQ